MNKLLVKNVTLDKKHTEMLNEFKYNTNILIPKYNIEIEKLENLISNKKNKNKTEKLEQYEYKIQELKNLIYKLDKQKKDYFLNNSKYIFDYFEEKKNINSNLDIKIPINNNKINNFFYFNESKNFEVLNNQSNENQNSINNTKNSGSKQNVQESNEDNKGYLVNSVSSNQTASTSQNVYEKNGIFTTENNESSVIDKYFYNINNSYIKYDNYCYESDICKYCNKGEMVYAETDGFCICNFCSKTMKYLIENEKPSYKEPPKEVCFYAYKRINHLREILAQFQAKESTHIPKEVFENIKNQIKKERLEIKDLTNKKTKEILKNLGYNKYYEHIPFIKDKLGIKPPVMSPDLEDKLCNLFLEIQKPYAKFCPKDRVNFLNYYYTLYKLCELLGEIKFLPFFPQLKDREKKMEQDAIWKLICEDLGWTFIPTV